MKKEPIQLKQSLGLFTIKIGDNKVDLSVNNQDKLDVLNKLYPDSMNRISTAFQLMLEKEINRVKQMEINQHTMNFLITTLGKVIQKQPFHLRQMLLNKV